MKKGISRKVPHTYIQHGVRFYAMLIPVQGPFRDTSGAQMWIDAHNWYIFDEYGDCWDNKIHIDRKRILNEYGNGFFKDRVLLEIDAPMPSLPRPRSMPTPPGSKGSADKGYALETIQQTLGLNITLLREICCAEQELRNSSE